MTDPNDVGRARRRGWQIANAALVVIAAAGWARGVGAADPPRRIGAGGVLGLVIDPRTPATLYAQTQCGGVLKSTDGGNTWIVANTGLPDTFFVTALAIDPITPSTLYAGTYDVVFKSTDAGATWAAANAGLTSAAFALTIDPVTPSTVYAGMYAVGDATTATPTPPPGAPLPAASAAMGS